MLTVLLIIQPASSYYLSMELEVLYKNMLKYRFSSNTKWNEMPKFNLIPTKLLHKMIIQIDEDKGTSKVTHDIVETSHQSQRGATHKGRRLSLRSRQLAIYL
jgi:hypothetical protein